MDILHMPIIEDRPKHAPIFRAFANSFQAEQKGRKLTTHLNNKIRKLSRQNAPSPLT